MSGHRSPELFIGKQQKVELRIAPRLEQNQECPFSSFLSMQCRVMEKNVSCGNRKAI